jgi:hypothetical protein
MRSRRQPAFILRSAAIAGALPALLLVAGGCVERTLQIQSDPPGALVHLNGEEAGRTPMRKNFIWYGTYDVQLRKEGYVAKNEQARVWAPWLQIPPIDLLFEILPVPLRDNHAVSYRMEPLSERQTDPEQLIDRAAEMRGRLRSSEKTRQPGEKRE